MTRAPRQARCPICGASLPDRPWRCQRCDTPHHADCAEYFGGCAIFGCRDGQPPQRLEMAQWPEAVSAMRSLGRCRTAQDVLLTTCVLSFALLIAIFAFQAPSTSFLVGPLVCGFLGCFAAYIGLDAIWAEWRWRQLRHLLSKKRRFEVEVPRERLRAVLPSTRSRFLWLSRTGQVLLAAGVLAYGVSPELALMLVTPGSLLWAAAHQLGVHRAQLQMFQNRLEASYAPPALDKSPPPKA